MANANNVFLGSCRVSYGASNLTGAYPHTGGTALGVTSRVEIRGNFDTFRVVREEDGSTQAVYTLGGDIVVGFYLDEWDNTSRAQLFPRTRTDVNSDEIVQFPPAVTGLTALSPLVFTPRRTTDENPPHPALSIFSAYVIPDLTTTVMRLSSLSHLRVPLIVRGQVNASGIAAELGPISTIAVA